MLIVYCFSLLSRPYQSREQHPDTQALRWKFSEHLQLLSKSVGCPLKLGGKFKNEFLKVKKIVHKKKKKRIYCQIAIESKHYILTNFYLTFSSNIINIKIILDYYMLFLPLFNLFIRVPNLIKYPGYNNKSLYSV